MKTNKNQHGNSHVAFILFLERLYFLSSLPQMAAEELPIWMLRAPDRIDTTGFAGLPAVKHFDFSYS